MADTPKPNGATQAADAAITQGFMLLRVQAGMRNQALGVLVELEKELQGIIAHGGGSPSNSQKYKDMLAEAQVTIAQAYSVIAKSQDKDLEQIAGVSWKAGNGLLNKTVGVDLFSGKIPPKILEAVTNAPVVMGHPAKDWWAGQSADLRQKFVGQMALGTLLGETNQQLTQRIIGAGIVGKIDPAAPKGIMKKAKADATALVRTSVQSVSNYAKIQSFIDKPDVVKGIQWLATLDSRTTVICMGLSKKQWRLPDFAPVGHDKKFPGPTAHWQCRSTQVPITYSWAELSGKKLPSIDNETLQKRVDEILEKKGFDPARRAAALVRSQASMDGQVSNDLTYQDWAENKGADFIEQAIGPGRAVLFNKGLIDFSDLTDQDNRPLTIAELEQAIDTGKLPPETLGAEFIPAKRQPFVDVAGEKQKAAAAATQAAQEEAAKVLAAQRAAAEQAAAEAAAAAKEAADKAAAIAKAAAVKAAAEKAAAEAEALAKAEAAAQKAKAEAEAKAKIEAAAHKSLVKKYVKATADGVAAKLSLVEQTYLDSLDTAGHTALQEDIDAKVALAEKKAAKKAAKEAAKKPVTTAAPDVQAHNLDLYVPNPASLQFVKVLPGSTAPKLMLDPATGKQWVVKTSSDAVHLKTEATADQVYRLMGIQSPGSAYVEIEGKAYKVAEFIPDAPTLGAWAKGKKAAEVQAMYADARKGFVLDSLLGNWDVAGQSNDNMLVKDGHVVRIDNGGTFNYRAQGGLKTADQFGTVVNELKTLREKGTAAGKTADIFKGATQNEIDTQIAAIVAKRSEIVATVQQQLGAAVAGTIDDRIAYLESLLPPGMRKAPAAPAGIDGIVFAPKFDEASRTRYGASLSLGNAAFEDQQVLVWHELDPAKQALVKAQGNMTLAGSAAFQAKMEAAGFAAVPSGQTAHSYQSVVSAKPVHPQDVYYNGLVQAAKTVSAHAVDKKYNATTLKAFDDLVAKAKQDLATSTDPGTKAMLTHYLDAAAAIQQAKDAGAVVGTKVVQFPYTPAAAKAAAAPTQNTVINGVTVTRMDVPKIDYTKKEIIGGVLQDTGVQNRGPKMPAAYKLSRGNVEVTVVPYAPDVKTNRSARSYQGVVRVNVKGTDTKAAMNEAAALLHDVGLLDTVQATAAQRELLYLQKGVYLRGDQADKGYTAALAHADEAARLEALKVWAEQKYGVKLPRDGTTSRYYNPDGEIPENGVGNRFWRRWDVPEAEAAAAEAGSKFYHSSSYLDDLVAEVLKNGSHLTSSWQRLRTGVALSGTGGASSDADLDAGGGDFFYTNHIPKGGHVPKKGIVFKGDSVTRIDLASHTYDSFGAWEANEGTTRRRTLAQITSASGIGISTNTGLFRGGLSLEQVDTVKAGSAAAAKALIARIKASGISQWPDGRKLETVIKA